MIPYGKQEITREDIESVVKVLKSDFLTQGPIVPEFESQFCIYTGANYAIAMNSATSALHVACLALELGSGDQLWTSTISYVASANCGLYCGATIDFIDIDPITYNISVPTLERKLQLAELKGKLPKVIVAVHLCGQSCDMQAINALSKRYGFKVIEDASHAVGGRYKEETIGNCRYSDITVFSFHPVKIITTAEGGMALTNNLKLADRMALLRSHGVTRDESKFTLVSQGPWYYEQQELGFNYRMTDIHAALGSSQLSRLDNYVDRRNNLAKYYNDELGELPLQLPRVDKQNISAFHLYVIRLKLNDLTKSHREIFEELRDAGIGVNLHYTPIHLQPYYRNLGFGEGDFPQAEMYGKEAITLPMFPTMSTADQEYVVTTLESVLN